MSGIFGIIRPPEFPVYEEELTALADALKQRGPDGIHCSARENVGLGHCMLVATPEAVHETLPLRDATRGLTITADARIDNRKQLMAAIPLQQATGQVITDSQLILHAYAKWGEACVAQLLGDFAFAIWDERAQTLFAARDHMGCKPFYYHQHKGQLVFASSAIGVKAAPGVAVDINRGRVADCLVDFLESIDKTSTFFTGIYRLPPGHVLVFARGKLRTRCYWQPSLGTPVRYTHDDDYLAAFEEIFDQAVCDRLRSYRRPAAMLSGGVDSSVIAALARNRLQGLGAEPLQTYTAIDNALPNCSEAHHAGLLISRGGIENQQINLDDVQRFHTQLEDWREGLEDPFDFEMIVNALVYFQASQQGNRVILTGLDGDLVAGLTHAYIAHIIREGHWREAWREARGLVQNNASVASGVAGELWKSALQAAMPHSLQKLRRPLQLRALTRRTINSTLISAPFAQAVNLHQRIAMDRGNPGREDLAQTHQRALRASYLTAAIERYERVAAGCGVDSRHPLLDKRVVEFMLNIPRRQKFRQGWSKYLLRRLAVSHTVPEIAWRTSSNHPGWHYNERWDDSLSEAGLSLASISPQSLGLGDILHAPGASCGLSTGERQSLEVSAVNMLQWLRKNG